MQVQQVLGSAALFAFGLYFGSIAWGAWKSGIAETGNARYRRKKSPAMYWTTAIVQTFFCLMLVVGAVMRLARP